jgi:hypothetical protein
MYAEVYSFMQQYNARRARENMLVKFDFSFQGGKLGFDINKFKESYEVLRRIRKPKNIWTLDDLFKLFKLIKIIREGLKNMQSVHYDAYRRGVNYKLHDAHIFMVRYMRF